jgi:hypothetical protein
MIEQPKYRPNVPAHAFCFFKDGNKWCCVYGDYIDLQMSPAGFGDTFEEAMEQLKAYKPRQKSTG